MAKRILTKTNYDKLDVRDFFHFAIRTIQSQEYHKLNLDLGQVGVIDIDIEIELIEFITNKYISKCDGRYL
jgi:hypothetical protein